MSITTYPSDPHADLTAAKAAYDAKPSPANRQAYERAVSAWNAAGQPGPQDDLDLNRRWRVVIPAGIGLVRRGFDEQPSDGEMSDLIADRIGAAIHPPDGKAPTADEDLVDYIINEMDCEHLGVTVEQARAVVRALGGAIESPVSS